MRRRLTAIIMAASLIFTPITARAEEVKDFESDLLMVKGYATAYCLQGITASGEETRDGICSGCKDYFGKTILLYQRLPDDSVGKLIGIYECLDTGSGRGIKKGTVIDVWCPDLEACQDYMDLVYEDDCKGGVYIVVTNAVG